MDRRAVQRIVPFGNTQKPDALLEGLGAKTRYLLQLLTRGELAVLLAELHDILGDGRVDARHIREQRRRGRVHVDTDMVNGRFHDGLKALLQMLLRDIVLVLPDPDRLRVDLDQLRERVLHAAGNRCGAALGHIQVRELLRRQLGGGIDAGSCLVHDQVRQLRITDLGNHLGRELLRLPRAGAVADDNQLDAVFGNQLLELRRRLLLLVVRRRRIGHCHLQQLAGVVDNGKLAAGAVSRVNAEHIAAPDRRLQQQAAQIARENRDRLRLALLCHFPAHLALHRRRDQPLVGILGHSLQQLLDRGWPLDQLSRDKAVNLIGNDLDPDLQHTLPLPAVNRENAVRRHFMYRLTVAVVVLVDTFLLRILRFRDQNALARRILADPGPDDRIISDILGDDIHCALQRRLGIVHTLV
ncbi:hypothetical protein D3C75_241470 [compost metagenome]